MISINSEDQSSVQDEDGTIEPSKFTSFSIYDAFVALGHRCERSITSHERRSVLLILALFGLFNAYHSYYCPLWFDEIFTLCVSRLSSWSAIARAIPVDGQPPMQHLLTHLSMRFFGESAFAVRIPEQLACLAAGLLAYKIVRRHGTTVQALFAMVLLLGAAININQAKTARPYELLLAFTALAFASWQEAALRPGKRFVALCGVGLGVAGAVSSHFFGLIHVGIFLAAGESVRLFQRRRVDWGMLVAIAAGLVPLAWTLPLIHQAQVLAGDMVVRSTNFFAKPAPSDLLGYMQMFAFPMIIIGVFVFLIWPKRVSCIDAVDLPRVYGFEWAAAGALCLVLPAQILVAELLTNYSLPRYSVSASLGLALLGGWAIPRISPLRKYSQIVLALSMGTFLLISTLFFLKTQIHKKVWSAKPYKGWASSLLARAPGDLPIVVSNAYDYAPDWWYSSRAIQGRIIYLSDLPYAVQQADFLPEFGLVKGQEFLPMPVSDYARFLQNHGQFLLLVSGAPRLNWLPARLTSAGWHLETVTTSEDDVLYRVTKP